MCHLITLRIEMTYTRFIEAGRLNSTFTILSFVVYSLSTIFNYSYIRFTLVHLVVLKLLLASVH